MEKHANVIVTFESQLHLNETGKNMHELFER